MFSYNEVFGDWSQLNHAVSAYGHYMSAESRNLRVLGSLPIGSNDNIVRSHKVNEHPLCSVLQ